MIGTINCVYETPCGWCSKWNKKCDKKTPERGLRAKCNLIDDVMDDSLKEVYVSLGRIAYTLEEIKKNLKYYLDTNEENGIVYIPKLIIEKIVYDNF